MASSPTSPRRAATRPRPSASTRSPSPCSRPIIRAPRRCSAPRGGWPAIMRAPAGPSRRSSCSARSSPPMSTAATARRRCAALLEPYFELLVRRRCRPDAVADLFTASQILVRPGVAQTQAVLARELSGGSDEAARLFRQSVDPDPRHRARPGRARPARGERRADRRRRRADRRAARLDRPVAAGPDRDAGAARPIPALPGGVERRARSSPTCRRLLRPGEAYYKMIVVGDHAYAIFATAGGARAFRIGATPAELDRQVDALRATISMVENNQQLTYPFDLELRLRPLSGAVRAGRRRDRRRHPPRLRARRGDAAAAAQPAGHGSGRRSTPIARASPPIPMTTASISAASNGSGRERDISTAVSVRAFRDVRQAPPSRARAEYLGFGENEPARGYYLPGRRHARRRGDAGRLHLVARRLEPADLGRASWSRPATRRAAGRAGEAEIVTGAAFTDTAIIGARRPRPIIASSISPPTAW